MPNQTSSAGPFRLAPDSDLAAGESAILNTREVEAGPRNKKGGLRKFYGPRGGFDYVQVTNGSDELITVQADGGAGQDVPPATTVTISGVGPDGSSVEQSATYTRAIVTNTGAITNASVEKEKLSIAFGNHPRPEEREQRASFNPLTALRGFQGA